MTLEVLHFKILAVSLYCKTRGQSGMLGLIPTLTASVTNGNIDSFFSFTELSGYLKGKRETALLSIFSRLGTIF